MNNDVSMNAMLNYGTDGNLYAGGLSVGNSYSSWDWCWPNHYHTTYVTEQPNKFETAFKIVSKLLEKKIVERLTVKQFIELVNEIAAIV